MKRIAVTMRVDIAPPHAERRDALDQRWHRFLATCGIVGVPVPNHVESALALFDAAEGLLLTGGNDLACFGGETRERDLTEDALLDAALRRGLPVIGVCRGMQFLGNRFACHIARVGGHAGTTHAVAGPNRPERTLRSYHHYGVTAAGPELVALAMAADATIEAFAHRALPIFGLMWHPEREQPAHASDVAFFRSGFGID